MSVFLSYCIADDQGPDPEAEQAKELSAEVRRALQAQGHQAFRDKDSIAVGDEWRRTIFQELANAYAAVVLLTTNALSRQWVIIELAVMTYRRERGEALKLLPVLVDGKTLAELERRPGTEWLSPLALKDLQMLAGVPRAELPRRIAEAIGPPPAQVPLTLCQELAAEIGGHLRDPLIDQHVLVEAAKKLGRPLAPQTDLERAREGLSSAMAESLISDGLDKVSRAFHVLADRLGPRARDLLSLLGPLWVHREHALRLAPRGAAGVLLEPMPWDTRPPGRVLGLDGAKVPQYTALRYVERAYWPRPYMFTEPQRDGGRQDRFAAIRVTNTDGDPEDIKEEIRSWIRRTTGLREEADVDEWINTNSYPVFVVLPKGWSPDPDALPKLRGSFPKVVFLVDVGELPAERTPPEIERLPPVDRAAEQSNWLCHHEMAGMCP